MARHRNIRSMNYDEEYEGYYDVYGHSAEDDYCVSPSTASEFIYDRNTKAHPMSAFLSPAARDALPEEDEDSGGENSLHRTRTDSLNGHQPKLNQSDKIKLQACIEEMQNVVGDTIPEATLLTAAVQHNFSAERALDAILSSPGDQPKPQRIRRERKKASRQESLSEDESCSSWSDEDELLLLENENLTILSSGKNACDAFLLHGIDSVAVELKEIHVEKIICNNRWKSLASLFSPSLSFKTDDIFLKDNLCFHSWPFDSLVSSCIVYNMVPFMCKPSLLLQYLKTFQISLSAVQNIYNMKNCILLATNDVKPSFVQKCYSHTVYSHDKIYKQIFSLPKRNEWCLGTSNINSVLKTLSMLNCPSRKAERFRDRNVRTVVKHYTNNHITSPQKNSGKVFNGKCVNSHYLSFSELSPILDTYFSVHDFMLAIIAHQLSYHKKKDVLFTVPFKNYLSSSDLIFYPPCASEPTFLYEKCLHLKQLKNFHHKANKQYLTCKYHSNICPPSDKFAHYYFPHRFHLCNDESSSGVKDSEKTVLDYFIKNSNVYSVNITYPALKKKIDANSEEKSPIFYRDRQDVHFSSDEDLPEFTYPASSSICDHNITDKSSLVASYDIFKRNTENLFSTDLSKNTISCSQDTSQSIRGYSESFQKVPSKTKPSFSLTQDILVDSDSEHESEICSSVKNASFDKVGKCYMQLPHKSTSPSASQNIERTDMLGANMSLDHLMRYEFYSNPQEKVLSFSPSSVSCEDAENITFADLFIECSNKEKGEISCEKHVQHVLSSGIEERNVNNDLLNSDTCLPLLCPSDDEISFADLIQQHQGPYNQRNKLCSQDEVDNAPNKISTLLDVPLEPFAAHSANRDVARHVNELPTLEFFSSLNNQDSTLPTSTSDNPLNETLTRKNNSLDELVQQYFDISKSHVPTTIPSIPNDGKGNITLSDLLMEHTALQTESQTEEDNIKKQQTFEVAVKELPLDIFMADCLDIKDETILTDGEKPDNHTIDLTLARNHKVDKQSPFRRLDCVSDHGLSTNLLEKHDAEVNLNLFRKMPSLKMTSPSLFGTVLCYRYKPKYLFSPKSFCLLQKKDSIALSKFSFTTPSPDDICIMRQKKTVIKSDADKSTNDIEQPKSNATTHSSEESIFAKEIGRIHFLPDESKDCIPEDNQKNESAQDSSSDANVIISVKDEREVENFDKASLVEENADKIKSADQKNETLPSNAAVNEPAISKVSRSKVAEKDLLKEYEKERSEGKSLINLVVIGHVDAGKSTLMGHLLYRLGCVAKKMMHKYEQDSKKLGKASFMFAWVLDETSEERTRGITMDVAQSKFETPHRVVTLLDAPGHKDFIPNMITGAAQADVAILVVDATRGEFETGFEAGGQTREHTLLVRSLGVSQLAIAINKLDNVDWSQERYNEIVSKLSTFLRQAGFKDSDVVFVPCSGLTGENLTESAQIPVLKNWYIGPCLVEVIDGFKPPERPISKPFRLCIGDVFKSMGAGFCISGRIEAGYVQNGDRVMVMPAGEPINVKGIVIDESSVQHAFAGDHVTLQLAGVDMNKITTGSVICDINQPVRISSRFQARIVVFNVDVPITRGFPVVIHYQSVCEQAVIRKLISQLHKSTGQVVKKKPRCLTKNSSAVIELEVTHPICLELYKDYRELGRFMLRSGGSTVAAGLVTEIF